MAWTASVRLDFDKTDVGTVSITYSDAGDAEFPPDNPFTWSGRVQANASTLTALAWAGIAKRDAERAERQRNATAATAVAGRLNSEDV